MNKTFKGYINYGVLAAEKRKIWTADNPHSDAVISDPVEIAIPDGWELAENSMGFSIVIAPWGEAYTLNELLYGDKYPYFIGIDKDGNKFQIKLEYKMG